MGWTPIFNPLGGSRIHQSQKKNVAQILKIQIKLFMEACHFWPLCKKSQLRNCDRCCCLHKCSLIMTPNPPPPSVSVSLAFCETHCCILFQFFCVSRFACASCTKIFATRIKKASWMSTKTSEDSLSLSLCSAEKGDFIGSTARIQHSEHRVLTTNCWSCQIIASFILERLGPTLLEFTVSDCFQSFVLPPKLKNKIAVTNAYFQAWPLLQ